MLAAELAGAEEVGSGMWRCNMRQEKHVMIGFVKSLVPTVEVALPVSAVFAESEQQQGLQRSLTIRPRIY